MGDITMVDVDQARPDPDPIKASYDVYIKPGISGDRQVYVLQFPNRHAKQHYSQENDSKPFDLRIKPESGMVEVDVPIDVYRNYDRQKGVTWGDAAKKSSLAKGGGSHGMPGGFGIGGAQPNARGRGRAEAEDDTNEERLLEDFDGAVQRGQVLKKQTLGGQFVLKEDTSPQYMIGVWREDQLHLTPADQIVQMRPQFHHIDAHTEIEHQLRARESAAGAARSLEARAVHLTVKSAIDGEEDTGENMTERITAVQQEPWTRHRYIDEDTPEAWDSFHENLFVSDEAVEKHNLPEPEQRLTSGFGDDELLDTISATSDAAKLSRTKANRAEKVRAEKSQKEKSQGKGKGKGKEKEVAANTAESDSSTAAVGGSSEESEDEE